MAIQLEIVTPEASVLKEDVDEVVAPGAMGQFDVLPGHTTLLAELEKGAVTYVKGGQAKAVVISGGFAEVKEDHVTILADGLADNA
ncbi:MAG TPA: ATP synthase F1 subunit epsilon [bacterium]|nr:ATP synthase F1 subunit epsilon [bacterium]